MLFWCHFGVILVSFLVICEVIWCVILMSCWYHFEDHFGAIVVSFLGSFGNNFSGHGGVMLVLFWCHFGVMWRHFGVILVSFEVICGVILRSFWYHFEVHFRCHLGVILGP